MIERIIDYFECNKYKNLYVKEKAKYEELQFYVQQMINQHEEILDLLKQNKELKNKVAGVKFVK